MILNGTKWIIYHFQLHQCYGNTEMRHRNLSGFWEPCELGWETPHSKGGVRREGAWKPALSPSALQDYQLCHFNPFKAHFSLR